MSNEKDIESCCEHYEQMHELNIQKVRAKAQDLPNDGAGECEWCGEEFPRLVNNACGRCRDIYISWCNMKYKSGFKELTSSTSATIIPGATVKITTLETVRILDGHSGVIGIRKPLADNGMLIGSTLVKGGFNGQLEIHLFNASGLDYEVRKGDAIANIECFENARHAMWVNIDDDK